MRADQSAVKRQAWKVRRERYGHKGHKRAYRCVTFCANCRDLKRENAELRQRLAESVTSETIT